MRGSRGAEDVEGATSGSAARHPPGDPRSALTTPSSSEERESDHAPEYLSKLQGLFVLAQLMAESMDEIHILRLVGSSVPSLGPFRLLGIHLHESGWYDVPGAPLSSEALADVEGQLPATTASRAPVDAPGPGQAWAYAMRSVSGLVGHLAIVSEAEPTRWGHFLLGALAQQAGVALTNARLHSRQQAQAIELQNANSAFARTVSALERSTAIHKQLTRVAVAGEGEKGIAEALHELTGWPVAIEDRYGNLRAWAGPGQPDPYPKQPEAARGELIRRARATGRPVYEGDRLLTIAGPRGDVLGVILLVGVPPEEAEGAQPALEHGSTVLAMELARLQAVAETELRLGRDLVEDLLTNANEWAALNRARALGYDLRRRHRVGVVVEDQSSRRDPDTSFHTVRRAARDAGVGALLVPRGAAVVILSYAEADWDTFHRQVRRELGRDVFVGVGGPCDCLPDFPRSYREAMLALRVRSTDRSGRRTIFYEQLGTYRLLAEVSELSAIDRFVEEWLGTLIAYDSDHGAELVNTISTFLESRGNYDATAAALFVHRNTLKYRLRRIKEISSHDLKDPDTLFNLQLATRALSTRRALDLVEGVEPRVDDSTADGGDVEPAADAHGRLDTT
jgi:sugar diacid utilization regulator